MVYAFSQTIIIRTLYKKPPNNITQKLWNETILGFIKLSGISPSEEFIVRGILSVDIDVKNEIDVSLYINYLKLYTKSLNFICIESDKKILRDIIRKIEMGMIKLIDQSM